MSSNRDQDVKYIQEWMSKEAHLPEPFNDKMILRFLHATYYSLEQTKKCIERFCTSRHDMPHIYTQRDPLSPPMKLVNTLDVSAIYQCGKSDVFFYRLGNDVNKYNFNDSIKGITQKIDFWLETDSHLVDADAFVYDIINVGIKHVPKTNPFVFREMVLYILEGMPVRMKNIFLINAPAITQVFFDMVKSVLPEELIKSIVISPDDKCLQNFVDKKLLPADYGGDAPSLRDASTRVNDVIADRYRAMFADDSLWKGDATKIPRKADEMKGSFRTLTID